MPKKSKEEPKHLISLERDHEEIYKRSQIGHWKTRPGLTSGQMDRFGQSDLEGKSDLGGK